MASGAVPGTSPRAIPLALPQALRPLVDFCLRAGLPLADAPSRLVRNDARALPQLVGGRLWADAVRVTGDEGLALRVGASARWREVPLGRLVPPGATLGEALETLAFARSSFCTGQHIGVRVVGDDVRVEHAFADALREGRRPAGDFALLMMIDLVRSVAGPDWRPERLHIEGPRPIHHEELASLAAGGIRFGGTTNALLVPRDFLGMQVPPASAGPQLPPVPRNDFVASARDSVHCLLELGELSLPGLASAAGISARSLQRHLAESGSSYARLADEARFEAARHLLGDPHARVTDVALDLGYTDVANFTRAFRRWAGVPPLEFRRLRLVGSG